MQRCDTGSLKCSCNLSLQVNSVHVQSLCPPSPSLPASRVQVEAHQRRVRQADEGAVLPEPVPDPLQQVEALLPQQRPGRGDGGHAQDAQPAVHEGGPHGVVEVEGALPAYAPPPEGDAEEQPRPAHVLDVPRLAAEPSEGRPHLARAEPVARSLHVRTAPVPHVVPAVAARPGLQDRGVRVGSGAIALDEVSDPPGASRPVGRVARVERLPAAVEQG
mmetsp:Transcript_50417/g.162788  ORF Transcript_50417/g.162788 Transcript_50417/m.162788 type:complete len:218 (+) Transcript_50417:759-1412(+)